MQELFPNLPKAVTMGQRVSTELVVSNHFENLPSEPPSSSKFRQEPLPDRNRTYDKETRWPTKDKNYYLMTKRKVNPENKLKVTFHSGLTIKISRAT